MVKGALALTAGYDSTHIKARIQAFEDFGIHRTGGPGDDQTSHRSKKPRATTTTLRPVR